MSMNALPRPEFVRLGDIRRRPRLLEQWEKVRHRRAHWFIECFAEALGVFIYCYAGVGSTAAWVVGTITGQSLSSLYQVGIAYAIGIVLAMATCASTSGGHFHPAFTLVFMLFRKFPIMKGIRYMIAQILGGFLACLVIYLQYRHILGEIEAGLAAKGVLDEVLFTVSGPAGIFGNYAAPGASIGQIFLNEFTCCFMIGVVYWSVFDPTNFFVSPVAGPWLVALTYAMCIWGYGPVGVALNTARDLGGRFLVLAIWGTKGSGGSFAALTALTNLVATPLGVLCYEIFLTDSSRVIVPSGVEFIAGHMAHGSADNEESSGSTNSDLSIHDKEQA